METVDSSPRLVRWVRGVDRMAFALAVYLLARAVFGPRLWPLSWVEPLLPWLALPSFVFLGLALAARHWRSFAAHAVIAGSWIALFGGSFAANEKPPTAAERVEILSFNVASGLARIEQLEPLFRASGADVIVIQELDDEEAGELEHALLDVYPHRVLHGLGVPGKGVLSKFPILESELFRLDATRPYLRAVLDVHGERWTVFDVHLPFEQVALGPFGVAEDDARELARRALAAAPALLVGDFNSTPNMRVHAIVEDAGLVDAFETCGSGLAPTFPVFGRYHSLPWPRCFHLDYVWHTHDLVALDAAVVDAGGSDHRPVRATLARRATPER
ncbi:MAG: endonuclease/exonuclease/phosphatase family protein [Planctomycetes bacterium]|nr:endonuclease/exonuclease/phosphatase family protein [Planctomycetota bacterium]